MKLIEPITILGKVIDGKPTMNNKPWFLSRFEGLDNCNIRWIVEKERKPRSRKLENYYYGHVLPLGSQNLGYSPEDLHDVFKALFLKRTKLWRGIEMVTIISTKKLSQDEYSDFVDKTRGELSSLGIITQDPDKYYKERHEFGDTAISEYVHRGR